MIYGCKFTGIRFQAASNGNLSGELQPQQLSKVAVDGAVRSNLGADSQLSEVHDGGSNRSELQGNKSAAVPVAKPGKSSKWGPAPSSEDGMSSEVANDFEAAKVAAIRAAELGKWLVPLLYYDSNYLLVMGGFLIFGTQKPL